MRGKVVFLLNENKDRTLLPPLSRDKDKKMAGNRILNHHLIFFFMI
jgi:hypothetical protein